MVFVRGVGAVAARSAACGHRFYDGLAETSDRGFISGITNILSWRIEA